LTDFGFSLGIKVSAQDEKNQKEFSNFGERN